MWLQEYLCVRMCGHVIRIVFKNQSLCYRNTLIIVRWCAINSFYYYVTLKVHACTEHLNSSTLKVLLLAFEKCMK